MARGTNHSELRFSCRKRGSVRLLFAFLAALAFAGVLWIGLSDLRATFCKRALDACRTETVHVIVGDTLWSIASSHGAKGTSTYEVVEWIKERNGLTSSEIKPGTRLLVPLIAS